MEQTPDYNKHILPRIKYNSPVILSFTFLSFFIVLIGYFTNNEITKKFFMIYYTSLYDPLFYIRLFTHVIGQIDFNHFFSNFMIILLIGPMLEEKYGSMNILFMMMFTAFITGILHILISDTALLGASGIVFMFILLSSFTNFQKGTIPFTFILVVVIFLGQEILNGIFLEDNVSRLVHITGGILGTIIGFFIQKDDD